MSTSRSSVGMPDWPFGMLPLLREASMAPTSLTMPPAAAISFLKFTGHTEFAKTFLEHLLNPAVLLRRVNL